ncbi:MAG TPA: CbiQ family ECF transporter T component [Actinomycetales bacterium]|nr:CbiQ family ECF transporter T component [Actinomycetales bacterium]
MSQRAHSASRSRGSRLGDGSRLPRSLHPGAWWVWALGMAVAASRTTNPLLLVLLVAASAFVVAARRTSTPWGRSYRMYLLLGGVVIGVRVVLHVVVGFGYGTHVLLRLPLIPLPSWAAGIELGGPVHLESLLDATFQGLRLATLIICLGAANSLANPKRLLRSLPGALHEVGVAVVVAVSVLPQLAESVQRVRRAQRLRGDLSRGLRGVLRVAMPVLQNALERSVQLAAAMDSRGYGRRRPVPVSARRTTTALLLASLVLLCLGVYELLAAMGTPLLAVTLLLGGAASAVGGLALGGRQVTRSRYRPDRWRAAEWLTAGTGLACAAGLVVASRVDAAAVMVTMQPLTTPSLPPLAMLAVLVPALAVVTAPPPPSPPRQRRRLMDPGPAPSMPPDDDRAHHPLTQGATR